MSSLLIDVEPLKKELVSYSHGAHLKSNNQVQFSVWAPAAKKIDLILLDPSEKIIPLKKSAAGYFKATLSNVKPQARYFFQLNGKHRRPDPASRYQPDGVHGPSAVVPAYFSWTDHTWKGLPLAEYVIYELHVGTFSNEGTFRGALKKLPYLKKLGITAIELMPLAQFAGAHNWGYDGVYPYAVQNTYGGPQELKKFVNACHEEGIAVVLDAVYNHLGPEGNYLGSYGPYFHKSLHTPWGVAINFDGRLNKEVRRYFIENALMWANEFHIDALRLDAIHAIEDNSSYPFLKQLKAETQKLSAKLKRPFHLIAESDLNDPKIIRPAAQKGYGLDAQWADDFHHALHALLTKERLGYYQDYGWLWQLRKIYVDGYFFTGQHSKYRKKNYGFSATPQESSKFVVYGQNHDQVGNRLTGERFSHYLSFEQTKLAAGLVLLSPFVPLLFMGEEYGETAPFNYFVDHSDTKVLSSVRRGRQRGATHFGWKGAIPDPYDKKTFLHSHLTDDLWQKGEHRTLFDFYARLIQIRKEFLHSVPLNRKDIEVSGFDDTKTFFVRRASASEQYYFAFNFESTPQGVSLRVPQGDWTKVIDSADQFWNGPGGSVPDSLSFAGMTLWSFKPQSLVVLKKSAKSK